MGPDRSARARGAAGPRSRYLRAVDDPRQRSMPTAGGICAAVKPPATRRRRWLERRRVVATRCSQATARQDRREKVGRRRRRAPPSSLRRPADSGSAVNAAPRRAFMAASCPPGSAGTGRVDELDFPRSSARGSLRPVAGDASRAPGNPKPASARAPPGSPPRQAGGVECGRSLDGAPIRALNRRRPGAEFVRRRRRSRRPAARGRWRSACAPRTCRRSTGPARARRRAATSVGQFVPGQSGSSSWTSSMSIRRHGPSGRDMSGGHRLEVLGGSWIRSDAHAPIGDSDLGCPATAPSAPMNRTTARMRRRGRKACGPVVEAWFGNAAGSLRPGIPAGRSWPRGQARSDDASPRGRPGGRARPRARPAPSRRSPARPERRRPRDVAGGELIGRFGEERSVSASAAAAVLRFGSTAPCSSGRGRQARGRQTARPRGTAQAGRGRRRPWRARPTRRRRRWRRVSWPGDQWRQRAQRPDETVQLDPGAATVMQAALEAVAEQRAERLALADPVEQPCRQPHAVRGEVDGESLRAGPSCRGG